MSPSPKAVKVQTFASPKQALIIGCGNYLILELFTDIKTIGILLLLGLFFNAAPDVFYLPAYFQLVALYITLGHLQTQLDAVFRCKEIYEKAEASKKETADIITQQLTLYLPTDRYHMASRILHSYGINLSRPIIKELKAVINIKVAVVCFTACALNLLMLLIVVFTSYRVFTKEITEVVPLNEVTQDNLILNISSS